MAMSGQRGFSREAAVVDDQLSMRHILEDGPTARVLASSIPIEKSEHPYANSLPSSLRAADKRPWSKRPFPHLTSNTVTGFLATSLRTTTSHLPSSCNSTTSSSLHSDSLSADETGALLGPATKPNVQTKALRGLPRFESFEGLAFKTA